MNGEIKQRSTESLLLFFTVQQHKKKLNDKSLPKEHIVSNLVEILL